MTVGSGGIQVGELLNSFPRLLNLCLDFEDLVVSALALVLFGVEVGLVDDRRVLRFLPGLPVPLGTRLLGFVASRKSRLGCRFERPSTI